MSAPEKGKTMSSDDTREVDYKTHILIGRTTAGDMAVIGEWPHVPRQSEVQQRIDGARQNTPSISCVRRRRLFRRMGQQAVVGKAWDRRAIGSGPVLSVVGPFLCAGSQGRPAYADPVLGHLL